LVVLMHRQLDQIWQRLTQKLKRAMLIHVPKADYIVGRSRHESTDNRATHMMVQDIYVFPSSSTGCRHVGKASSLAQVRSSLRCGVAIQNRGDPQTSPHLESRAAYLDTLRRDGGGGPATLLSRWRRKWTS
jgi:hypothetical protein